MLWILFRVRFTLGRARLSAPQTIALHRRYAHITNAYEMARRPGASLPACNHAPLRLRFERLEKNPALVQQNRKF
jgi:hypothetical protein